MKGVNRARPPAAGTGEVLVQTVVETLIEQAGITVEDFIRSVRGGRLAHESTQDFDETRTPAVHPGLPKMHGDIRWIRREGAYLIDVAHAMVHEDDRIKIRFWSAVKEGAPQVRFDGVGLSETTVTALIGGPLSAVTDHPCFADERILIRSGHVYHRTPEQRRVGPDSPSMTQFSIEVPCNRHPDQPWS